MFLVDPHSFVLCLWSRWSLSSLPFALPVTCIDDAIGALVRVSGLAFVVLAVCSRVRVVRLRCWLWLVLLLPVLFQADNPCVHV